MRCNARATGAARRYPPRRMVAHLPWLSSAGAGLLALGAATALHLAFWRRRLRLRPDEDELLRARTRDGWELALGRCRPRGQALLPPVLLVHGIAMNRQAFELGLPRYALARHLAAAGLDCFSLDLRGHGDSRPIGRGAARRFGLDVYLEEDLPAALEAIRAATGSDRVLYVGHSQGAALGLAAASVHAERIAGLVALAGPVHFHAQPRLAALASLRRPFLTLRTRRLARALAPFSGRWHPRPADLAMSLGNMEPAVTRRVLYNAVSDLHPGELEQFRAFIRDDAFRSMDGRTDHRAALARCRQPALFVAAARDEIAPPSVVEETSRRWAGPARFLVFDAPYGHTDLLFGRRAPEEVYPAIRDFLVGLAVARR
jgi:pimeloyl-ACP methyl ester carboxylesterase